ncbi:serine/threonine protein kinase [Pendulispora rubella]|uniref:Serine/threonine protein kinase n=1 Tax=Pendulispora rubella TaxID=2741070 RepID=A0ABZ2KUD8_9BACT
MPAQFDLVVSRRLDRYELLYEVGRGGMGSVWAAMLRGKHGFEKLVAIKTILPEFAAEPRFRALLLNEAQLTARIEHPNVVQTFELGEHNGSLYVVMEWVEGESLYVLWRDVERSGHTVIPIGVTLRVVADVCGGLHAAHEMRDANGAPACIVHNDISPHNILVTSRGISKLADFGVAKIANRAAGAASVAEMASLRGKVRYIAPERLSGYEDRRSDIWSLGVVLRELLPMEMPGPCQRVVDRAVASDRERRFGTAYELGRAIESVMDECQLSTTSADVASFFESALRERSAMRRRRVDATLGMGETLDVVRDLRPPPAPSPPPASIGGETVPLSRTLAVRSQLAVIAPEKPARRFARAWLVVAIAACAVVLVAGLVLFVMTRRSPAPTPESLPSASVAPAIQPPPPPSSAPPPGAAPAGAASSAPPPPAVRRPRPPASKASHDPYEGRL